MWRGVSWRATGALPGSHALKIFLSYSSQDLAQAEPIHLALLEDGHDVFFDRADLPAGDTFHDRIREEIGECDLFLFLASERSLAPGSYCLTELKFCRERWPHPRRRVLTVLMDGVTPEELPAYLRAVEVLTPEGNLVAETAGAIALLARRRKRRLLAAALGALVPLAGLALWWSRRDGDPSLAIGQPEIAPLRRGLGGSGDTYLVRATLVNHGRRACYVRSVSLSSATPSDRTPAIDATVPEAILPDGRNLAPGEACEIALPVVLPDEDARVDALRAAGWSLCCDLLEGDDVCSTPLSWRTGSDFAFPAAQPLPAAFRHRVRAVAIEPEGDSFYFAAADPCELARLLPNDQLENLLFAKGEPRTVAAGEGYAVLATTAPAPLYPYDLATRTLFEPSQFPPMQVGEGNDERLVSHWVRDLVLQDGWIGVLTGRENDVAGFFGVHPPSNSLNRPFFLEDFEHQADLRVRAVDGLLLGILSGTTPSSLYDFNSFEVPDGGYDTYAGHDVELVSCATDLADWPGAGFLLLDCDEELVVAEIVDARVELRQTLAKLSVPENGIGRWMDTLLASCGQRVLIAVTLWQQEPWQLLFTRIFTWQPRAEPSVVFEAPGWQSRSIATTAERGIVILEAADGRFDALEIVY